MNLNEMGISWESRMGKHILLAALGALVWVTQPDGGLVLEGYPISISVRTWGTDKIGGLLYVNDALVWAFRRLDWAKSEGENRARKLDMTGN